MAGGVWSLIVTSLPLLASLYTLRNESKDQINFFPRHPHNLNLPLKTTYDFIIVGAGTAGGIVASILSQKYSVLLIEAGGKPPPSVGIPTLYPFIETLLPINFFYESTPQNHAAIQNGGIIKVTGGKMLGGSSSHNGMAWQRGSQFGYDEWAHLTNDESWTYKNMLQYFKQLENYNASFKQNEQQHGQNGPVNLVEDSFAPGRDLWMKAGLELDYKIMDADGLMSTGFSALVFAKRRGRRVSSWTAYIQPALKRNKKNLKIFKYSHVSKILMKGKKAIGVEFTRHGVPCAAFASKEIILSAGTFESPIILINSGIGPLTQLQAAQVKPVAILPVGQNLMDTPVIFAPPIQVNANSGISFNLDRQLTQKHVNQFLRHGTGPITASRYSLQAFKMSKRAREAGDLDWPDVRIVFSPYGSTNGVVSCAAVNTRPLSRGVLTLNVSNNSPILNYNYYDQEYDYDVTIEGLNFCAQVMEETEAFKEVGAKFSTVPLEPCKSFKLRSKKYWKCLITQTAISIGHSVGTCRMGRGKDDPLAVVDPKLRVIGVKRLRIVDASIIPVIPNSSPAATVWMIGLKAATEILEEYSKMNKIN